VKVVVDLVQGTKVEAARGEVATAAGQVEATVQVAEVKAVVDSAPAAKVEVATAAEAMEAAKVVMAVA